EPPGHALCVRVSDSVLRYDRRQLCETISGCTGYEVGESVKSNREKRRQAKMRRRKIRERMSKQLVGLFLAVILALVGLAVRITYINATEGEQYSRIVLSQAQQQYESRTIAFKRGDIVDRNGTVLAT